MKDEPRPVHQLEHAEPTVIHHPEQDMTILARWLHYGMEQGARFWLLLGGVVAVIVAIAALSSGLAASKSAGSEAWVELTQAKTAEERLKIAEAYPATPAADWAKLQVAYEEYDNGLVDLTTPGKKESAGPKLKKALELFQQVAKDAPKDSSQALGASLGVARTLEARDELPEAIQQYRELATKFPNTPEAKQALALAKALEEPENVTFYKELYAYKPPAGPSAGGPMDFRTPPPLIPGMTPGFGSGPGSSLNQKSFLNQPAPAGLDAPPPSTGPTSALEPPKTEVPKAEEPKAEAPKAETPALAPTTPAPAEKPATPPK